MIGTLAVNGWAQRGGACMSGLRARPVPSSEMIQDRAIITMEGNRTQSFRMVYHYHHLEWHWVTLSDLAKYSMTRTRYVYSFFVDTVYTCTVYACITYHVMIISSTDQLCLYWPLSASRRVSSWLTRVGDAWHGLDVANRSTLRRWCSYIHV